MKIRTSKDLIRRSIPLLLGLLIFFGTHFVLEYDVKIVKEDHTEEELFFPSHVVGTGVKEIDDSYQEHQWNITEFWPVFSDAYCTTYGSTSGRNLDCLVTGFYFGDGQVAIQPVKCVFPSEEDYTNFRDADWGEKSKERVLEYCEVNRDAVFLNKTQVENPGNLFEPK